MDSSNDAASNLVELVDYLAQIGAVKSPYPEWDKFDTKVSMSDNNGGVIRF